MSDIRNYKAVVKEIRDAADACLYQPDPDIDKILRFGIIDSGAGNAGCFSAWTFACGDVRHVGAYCYYIIWFAEHKEFFSLHQLKEMLRNWPRQPAEFAGYVGFERLWDFVQKITASLDSITSKEEVIEVANALWMYANNLNAWIYHYIPWGAGMLIPAMTKADYRAGAEAADQTAG